MQAMATGELAVEDAKDISGMVEAHRRLIETVDLVTTVIDLEGNF